MFNYAPGMQYAVPNYSNQTNAIIDLVKGLVQRSDEKSQLGEEFNRLKGTPAPGGMGPGPNGSADPDAGSLKGTPPPSGMFGAGPNGSTDPDANLSVGDYIDKNTGDVKTAKAMRDMATNVVGVPADQAKGMSLGQLRGAVAAWHDQQKQQMQQAQMQDMASQAKQRDALASRAISQGGWYDQRAAAADAAAAAPAAPLQASYTEDPETGFRAMLYGKDAIPSGVNPAKVSKATAETIYDEQGNETGLTGIRDKNGKLMIQKLPPAAPTGVLKPVIDPTTNKPIPGFGMDATGKVHDFRSNLDKSLGTQATPDAAAAPAAAGKSGGSGKKGIYNPATGKVEWK